MQFIAHAPLKRLIDHLMLLNAGFAAEGFGHDDGKGMIPVAPQVFDGDIRVRNSVADKAFDFSGCHGHVGYPNFSNTLAQDMARLGAKVNRRQRRNFLP